MTITLDHVLAGLVGIPCIIGIARASENHARLLPAFGLLCALGAVFGPVISGHGIEVQVSRIGWITCGVVSIIVGIRLADATLSSLIITGGVLGALLELGVIVR
jgi:hypothetical protein